MKTRIFYARIFGDSKDEERAAILAHRSDEKNISAKRTRCIA